jgi:hypothetical protein
LLCTAKEAKIESRELPRNNDDAMRQATTLAIAAIAFVCGTAAAAPLVTYESPCECRDNHGQHRWSVKIDPSLPPTDANAIQSVTPGDI